MRISLGLIVLLTFFAFGADASEPSYIGPAGNVVFFTIQTAAGPAELWRTDGTAAGTFPLAGTDVNPVALPGTAAVLDGALYFSVRTDTKIWRSDGTKAGTFPITPDQPTGSAFLGAVNGRLFYLTNGTRELWRHDETGETLLATVRPTVGTTTFTSSATHDGAVFVGTEFGLWKSDGTPAGTTQLTTTPAYGLLASGKGVFFAGRAADTGDEIWLTDGTSAGTRLVSDLTPGSAGSFAPGQYSAAINSQGLFFFNRTGLGFSDGTAAGTRMIRVAKGGSLTVVGETAYFALDDGEHGRELWRSDGTDAGTTMVADSFGPNGGVLSVAPAATRVYYWGSEPSSNVQLFVSDGTAAGTHAIFPTQPANWLPGGTRRSLITAGDTAFFAASDDPTSVQPWITDGTNAGTHLIATVAPPIRAASAVSVTTSSPLVYGPSNRFTAKVSSDSVYVPPAGRITITQDGIPIATALPLILGTATVTWTAGPALTPGTHTYVVSYSGDENFLPASKQFTATVGRAAVHLATSSPAPDTLRIWAVGYASAPTGTVTVVENGTTARTVDGPLRAQSRSSGTLSYADAIGVSANATSVTVTYSGDDRYAPQTAVISLVKVSRNHAVRH
ncbi:MAG TPA: Ig-like domain repeat protein [Thermoanaerobaculia bacterium]|nr:Ig-like domain repeat protein [Thermoanaerobaculia bacterium]